MVEIPRLVGAQLDRELVGWLTTVAPSGQPQSSAVWFVRDHRDLVVYSSPTATRISNLAVNRRVAFNLRGDRLGDTIVTLEGTASVDPTVPPPSRNAAYHAKYRDEIVRIFGGSDAYDARFTTALRVEVTRLRHWGQSH